MPLTTGLQSHWRLEEQLGKFITFQDIDGAIAMFDKRVIFWCRKLIASMILLLIPAELVARFVLGLGNPPLYKRADGYEYSNLPNQDVFRFGNHIFLNAQGLRNKPISTKPLPGTIRVLCLGDSITFGGVETDQAKTYPYQLQDILNHYSLKHFEVLNASVAGWAIGNEEAYLQKEGIYHSQIVVLEHRTDNLFRPKTSGEIVGHVNYPDRKPVLALEEGFFRYLLPNFLQNFQAAQPSQLDAGIRTKYSEQDFKRNFASFDRIAKLVRAHKARLIVFLMEQPDELEPKYALIHLAKKELAEKAKELNIPYADIAEDFQTSGGKKLFRDEIHPNPAGNTVIAKAVAKLIQSSLKTSNGVNKSP